MGATARGARTLTLAASLPDRKLCGNGTGRGNGFQRARLVKAQREEARDCAATALLLASQAAATQGRRPDWGPSFRYFIDGGSKRLPRVRVDVLVRRDPLWSARRLDDDNLIRGLKAVMDGFTDAGVWADDRQVQWGTIAWETAGPRRGEVVITLTEIAD